MGASARKSGGVGRLCRFLGIRAQHERTRWYIARLIDLPEEVTVTETQRGGDGTAAARGGRRHGRVIAGAAGGECVTRAAASDNGKDSVRVHDID
jgi:hypothetical protein